jgi:hypothetical protein
MNRFLHKLSDVDLMKLYLTTLVRWTPQHVFNIFRRNAKPVHILFCMVDHYEPGTGGVTQEVERERVQELLDKYPGLARNHKDSAGNCPKRTWFFPPHYHRFGNLKDLVSLCEKGFGEIELHLHHGKARPDSPENLEKTITQCLQEYGLFGIFGTENGRKRYGFIHGDWALGNSRRGKFCGVDEELEILYKTGCFADFTFPCLNEANPSMINSIYYAPHNSGTPKSYNRGVPVEAHHPSDKGFMIIQGPMRWYFDGLKVRILTDGVYNCDINAAKVVDFWVGTSIHVRGRPEWIIVKAHTHGAVEGDVALGQPFHNILNHLEKKYNDGANYVLHYLTARELYNIIKAAEAGKEGDPGQYRDYLIKPPSYNSSVDCEEASNILNKLVYETYEG